MPKRELRKRGSGWDDESTDALLDIWNDITVQSEIDDASVADSVVYKNISNLMKERGYELSDSQCKMRMKTLKRNYRVARDNLKKSGKGRKIPKFYEKMDEILGHRPATSPLKTIQSGETKNAKSRRQLRVQTALKDIEEAASDSDSQPSDRDDPPNTVNNEGDNEAGNDDVNDPADDEVDDTGNSGEALEEPPAQGVDADTTAGSASEHDTDDAGPSNKRPRAANDEKKALTTKTTSGGKYQRKTARKSRLETTLSTIMGSFSSSNEEIESKHVDIEHKRLKLEFKKLEAEDKQREYELKKLAAEERQKREEREHMLRLTQMMLNSQRPPQQVQPQYTGMAQMPMQQQGQSFPTDNADQHQQYYNM